MGQCDICGLAKQDNELHCCHNCEKAIEEVHRDLNEQMLEHSKSQKEKGVSCMMPFVIDMRRSIKVFLEKRQAT